MTRWAAWYWPLAVCVLLLAPDAAARPVRFHACPASTGVQCTTVRVPLDRSGRVPGAVALHVERVRARGRATGTVVEFVGGPGDPATAPGGDASELTRGLERVLAHRNLVVFDVRGTGRSSPLRCSDLGRAPTRVLESASAACARRLGRRGAFYPGGGDPFLRPSLAAVPKALRELCGAGACGGITRDPVSDLSALVARLAKRALRGPIVLASGRLEPVAARPDDLLSLLLDGDLIRR